MSRIGKQPIIIPDNVTVDVSDGNIVMVKGVRGELNRKINRAVCVSVENSVINIFPIDSSKNSNMHSGTARSLINNMVIGVNQGFEKKLKLVGVGYRSKLQGNDLILTLGFSHSIIYVLPSLVNAETSSQTEIILKSIDKELLGKVAADIRSYKKPEVYKGKGIRYLDEVVVRKEAKKK